MHRFTFPGSPLLVSPPPRTLAGAIWQRELGFAKLALLNRGAALLDHWPALERERDIPPGVLAWECSVADLLSHVWESTFYRTVYTEEQIDTERTLHEGRWIFALITDLPGFSNISEQEARRFYHHIGGQLPHVSHMSADPIEMMVVAGRPGTIAKQMAGVGGVTPYDYALIGAPAWARVSSTGYFSVIDVPVSAPPDGLSFFVRVTDSNGLSMLVPVRVDIIN